MRPQSRVTVPFRQLLPYLQRAGHLRLPLRDPRVHHGRHRDRHLTGLPIRPGCAPTAPVPAGNGRGQAPKEQTMTDGQPPHTTPEHPGRQPAEPEEAERDPFERHVQALKRLAQHPDPYLVQTSPHFDPAVLELQRLDHPLPQATFGDVSLAARVVGAPPFPTNQLLLPYALRALARQRRFADDDAPEALQPIVRSAFAPFLELPVQALQQRRRELAQLELQTSARTFSPDETQAAHGAHAVPWPLPDDLTVSQFRQRLRQLEPPAAGFPEAELFFAPDILDDPEPPWPLPLPRPAPRPLPLPHWPWPPPWPVPRPVPWPPPWLCWFLSRDWRMYHHDERHSGHASGCSAITSTSVGGMTLRLSVPVDGPVITIPTIVKGKVYVGSSDAAGAGGTLYKIDLGSGTVEHTCSVPQRFPAYSQGIGGSPAVVGGRVYFTAIPGRVYCLDAATFALLWSV